MIAVAWAAVGVACSWWLVGRALSPAPRPGLHGAGASMVRLRAAGGRWPRRPRAALEREAMDVEAELLRLRGALASGATVVGGLLELADQGGTWAVPSGAAVAAVARGVGLAEALDQWAHDGGDDAARLVADALALASEVGGSHVQAVEGALGALRERAALGREVRALSSQARVSAMVLVATPLGFAMAVVLADPRARAVYLGPVGVGCLAVGGALEVAGAAWLRWLVGRVA